MQRDAGGIYVRHSANRSGPHRTEAFGDRLQAAPSIPPIPAVRTRSTWCGAPSGGGSMSPVIHRWGSRRSSSPGLTPAGSFEEASERGHCSASRRPALPAVHGGIGRAGKGMTLIHHPCSGSGAGEAVASSCPTPGWPWAPPPSGPPPRRDSPRWGARRRSARRPRRGAVEVLGVERRRLGRSQRDTDPRRRRLQRCARPSRGSHRRPARGSRRSGTSRPPAAGAGR